MCGVEQAQRSAAQSGGGPRLRTRLAELGVEQGAVFNAEISTAIQGFIVGSRPRRPGHPADRLDLDDGWDDHWLPPVGLPHPLADRTAHRLGDAGRICNLF